MKNLFILLSFLSMSLVASEGSLRISKAVKTFSPLAMSGIELVKVKPAKTVKAMLFQLALKKKYSTDESDFSWVGNSNDAWEADSTNWGETTMKSAYSYLFDMEKDYLDSLTPAEKAKLFKKIGKAKEGFKLLLNSGVKFGVAPMGAVQCGVTFAALAIIDPATGNIYLVSKEGSGC